MRNRSRFFFTSCEIVNQIKSCRDNINYKRVIEKILRSLPPNFNHAIVAIEQSEDLPKMTMYELIGFLLAPKQRINRSTNHTSEQAFQSKFMPKIGSSNYGENKNGGLNGKKE